MVLSLNEIRTRAIAFSHEWKGETREKAEAQTFWNEFFSIFGISRRRVASFEKPGIKSDGERGYIDLFWKGKLVVEHKSAGGDLNKAYSQALDYFGGLEESELPRYVIVTDFKKFKLYDLDKGTEREFPLENLVDNISLFYFIPEHRTIEYGTEDPVNIKAAELMGKLHDALKENGYIGHDLEILLIRLVFCLFADNTGIFEKDRFRYYIENKTNIDGTDLGVKLISLFEVLNTPEERRQKNLDEDINIFQYIDGTLFEERISIPSFDSQTRGILLECCQFDWSPVSPAIFGSMFQSVMNQEERHDLGAHYTSEKNIQKTIDALFLDDLKKDFEAHKNNKKYLEELLERIGSIKILDPACGCGNFLIISYRELRRLQIAIRKQIWVLSGHSGKTNQQFIDIQFDKDLNVDSMYGIELLEFPARIAQVGLWLMDHLVNMELSKEFGLYYKRLPLSKTANIRIGNALREYWDNFVPKENLTYILGNPPFVSKQDRDEEQQKDMELVFQGKVDGYGLLDYVCCWYVKASEYIHNTPIKVAFVSTNSITQGEQVGILGDYLINKQGVKINFAHRTFKWSNDARGKAHVYVVIIGFSMSDEPVKYLYDYEKPDSEPVKIRARNINPYLIDQENIFIFSRNKPLNKVPEIQFGSMPNDDGNFLFTDEEKNQFLLEEPKAEKYIRPLISAKEFLHGEKRWCLWLLDANPYDLNNLSGVKERIRKVKEYRQKSKREATKKLAEQPALFGEIRQPDSNYVFIPLTTSENRRYIPMAFFSKENIVNNTCSIIPKANLYHFGVLTSEMHMAWMRQICGRMKSDYRYSNNLVYNNFPWPENPSPERVKKVEECARRVLDVRKAYDSPLSDLYGPLSMPKHLLDAHKALDKAVDKCYTSKPFNSDLERLTLLFELYGRYNKKEG